MFLFFSDPKNRSANPESPHILRAVHRCIKKVTEDLENLHFNTAVSAMMIFMGEASKERCVSQETAESFVKLLSPFAPHVSQELWERMGKKDSIAGASWPTYDRSLAEAEQVRLAVQVNGKTRSVLTIPAQATREECLKMALADKKTAGRLGGRNILKEIYVPGKVLNLIVKD